MLTGLLVDCLRHATRRYENTRYNYGKGFLYRFSSNLMAEGFYVLHQSNGRGFLCSPSVWLKVSMFSISLMAGGF